MNSSSWGVRRDKVKIFKTRAVALEADEETKKRTLGRKLRNVLRRRE